MSLYDCGFLGCPGSESRNGAQPFVSRRIATVATWKAAYVLSMAGDRGRRGGAEAGGRGTGGGAIISEQAGNGDIIDSDWSVGCEWRLQVGCEWQLQVRCEGRLQVGCEWRLPTLERFISIEHSILHHFARSLSLRKTKDAKDTKNVNTA